MHALKSEKRVLLIDATERSEYIIYLKTNYYLHGNGADISVQNVGECDIECPYSPIYKPVCSSHDYTLANEEALKCRQILQPYSSECSHFLSIIFVIT